MELFSLDLRGHRIAARDMVEDDVETFVRYWHDGGADLEFLGIDPGKLGTREDTRERFRQFCRRGEPKDVAVGFTFCRDDAVIGFTNINILGRRQGYLHVHLTDPTARRQGILSAILQHSLPVLAGHVLVEYPIDGLVLETRTRNVGITKVVRGAGLTPRFTGHLADPDGLAGPGEFAVFHLDARTTTSLIEEANSARHHGRADDA